MITTTAVSRVTKAPGPDPEGDSDLLLRLRAEFHEMPDLVVTVGEAARLFAIDRVQCRRILDVLVANGVLTTDGRVYTRAGTGRRHT
jgi:response regulator of citrate/malate metabolism